MTEQDKKYVIEALEYALHGCTDNNGNAETHYNTLANAIEVVKNCSIPVVSGSYYWVKCFKDSEYEPAKAKDRHGNGELYFCFTNGSVKECKYVVDYKELNYR